MSELAAGLVLAGRFRLIRVLGRGGSAEVWLAEDPVLATEVALKIIPAADAAAACRLADALRSDLRTLQRLVHPGIVNIHAVYVDGARCCISMEAVIGTDAGGLRGTAWQTIVAAVLEVVDALQYAHAQGVVHGDLKAGNLLCDSAGHWRLCDFRMAALGADGAVSLSAVSPQQLDGAPPTVSDDVHALGALLHDLLSGAPPLHPGITPARIRTEVPGRLGVDGSGQALPLALVQLVAALLEKSPARRPAGMPAVRAVLEEILRDDEQLPGRGSVDGPATIAAPRRLRRPGAAGLPAWLVYAGGLVLLACLAGVLFILPKLVSERPVVLPPPPVAAAPESAALPPPPETVAEPEPAPAPAQAQAQAQESPPAPVVAEAPAKAPPPAPHKELPVVDSSAADFERALSRGLGALAAGRLAEARQAIDVATGLRPGDPGAKNALAQLVAEERRERIATLEAEARKLEAAEQWQGAVSRYEAMLGIDANLLGAQKGLAAAQARASLNQQLEQALARADRFNDDAIAGPARQLVAQAAAVPAPGPVLSAQIERLEVQLKIAAQPVPVQFESDNQTNVVIYKIGTLGVFSSRTLDLRPGRYVVVGTRDGYRDVRRNIRVDPAGNMPPVVIRCEEAI
ncbi:MAG: protein kinase [Chromatiales bacterium]|nr:protein kinase [Chromatiales bacterium]